MKWNKITSPSEPEFPTDKLVVSYRETGSYIPTNSKSVLSLWVHKETRLF